jgi:hypothetical protein
MELLKDIAHISGKSGLYRIVKPTRSGVIVESLDKKKERTVVGGNSRVSVLKDISVYLADNQDASKPLAEIFTAIKEQHGEQIALQAKTASDTELRDFMEAVVPNFDRDKVYTSDIRKIINWYNLVSTHLPEALVVEESEGSNDEEVKGEEVTEAV